MRRVEMMMVGDSTEHSPWMRMWSGLTTSIAGEFGKSKVGDGTHSFKSVRGDRSLEHDRQGNGEKERNTRGRGRGKRGMKWREKKKGKRERRDWQQKTGRKGESRTVT